jgi:hypothetical protein
VARHENPTIGAIDDISAALSAIRESVVILATRGRGKLNGDDLDELERILAAAERIQEYHLALRAPISAAYQEPKAQPENNAD